MVDRSLLNGLILFCFIVVSGLLYSNELKVVSEVDGNSAYANQPIKGTITITHDHSEKIDENSFRIENEPLKVAFVKDVIISPNAPLVISIFSFKLPGKSAGLYVLPSVSVRIGGQVYYSAMSSYTVSKSPTTTGGNESVDTTTKEQDIETNAIQSKGPEEPLLKLEASVDGKTSLYPGQRTKLVYHYFYKGNIELLKENLPLLDAVGLVKIGEKEFKDYHEGEISVSEISQEVEAVKPGNYSFGPSLIEGFAYEQDALGTRTHTSPKLSSEAPAVEVKVLPFPETNKPASFTGAIGNDFKFKVMLMSPKQMQVGDEITLSLAISGKGNIKAVPLPEVCCQPGYSGFFRVSDLPPTETVEGDTKNALVRIYPLADSIKEIPSLEFSYFDPETESYHSIQSPPISISVGSAVKPSLPQNKDQPLGIEEFNEVKQKAVPYKPPAEETTDKKESTRVALPSPIEIESIVSLGKADLYDKPFGTWWVFAIVPLALALLIYQNDLYEYLSKQRKLSRTLSSQELFDKVLEQQEGSSAYFDLINRSLKTSLVEAGLISTVDIEDEDLPKNGVAGEVRTFIFDIAKKRFATHEKMNFDLIKNDAQALLDKVHSSSMVPGESV